MAAGATSETDRAARVLTDRLGAPDLGVVLGSGFSPVAARLGAGQPVPPEAIPGYPRGAAGGHGGGVSAAVRPGGRVWTFHGRLHLYEGLTVERVVLPVDILAAAGARGVLLTCAAGGLAEGDRPGDLVVVGDHLNLTGADPAVGLVPPGSAPRFVDLQDAYDPRWRSLWERSLADAGVRRRTGVLAAVRGPCYETPAEVRALRVLGADVVSMSTVPEVIAARFHGLRVAALACVANTGSGLGNGGAIEHDGVLETVAAAVEAAGDALVRGIDAMLA